MFCKVSSLWSTSPEVAGSLQGKRTSQGNHNIFRKVLKCIMAFLFNWSLFKMSEPWLFYWNKINAVTLVWWWGMPVRGSYLPSTKMSLSAAPPGRPALHSWSCLFFIYIIHCSSKDPSALKDLSSSESLSSSSPSPLFGLDLDCPSLRWIFFMSYSVSWTSLAIFKTDQDLMTPLFYLYFQATEIYFLF